MVKCCTGHKLGRLAPDLAEVMAWLREINYDRLWSNQIVLRTDVNGIPAINFSGRVQQILVRDMTTTVVISKPRGLQESSHPRVVDRDQTVPHYSIVDPQSLIPFKTFPVAPWSGSGCLTDKGSRGKFTQMAVFIDLGKPLISQILVKKVVQRVEFESLPLVCFYCGRFGHMQNLCPSSGSANVTEVDTVSAVEVSLEKYKVVETMEVFGPWMLVEQKAWRNSRN
ncbi:hypothetical protein Goari_023891 [Gossypium aridum]|uniref:CCHC-type domain-containing protein n=1 Tax=Gossypium aridum TaxID=34290 RepID=A0A7J8X4F9_GOSAI|nr:hypothetical protein [Gossypium aridum]